VFCVNWRIILLTGLLSLIRENVHAAWSGSSHLYSFSAQRPSTCSPSVVWHSADMAEQLKLSLSDGVHHCPLPLHLSSDFIVGVVILSVDFQYDEDD